jgi:hypothetical protein
LQPSLDATRGVVIAMEHPMQRCFTNILCADVDGTASFYENLLGMHRHYDSDWFVILSHHDLAGSCHCAGCG